MRNGERARIAGLGSEYAAQFDDPSVNREFQPYDLVAELVSCGCLVAGEQIRLQETFEQSIDDYITSIHSRNGFSRDRMSRGAARQFDEAVQRLISPHAQHGRLGLTIETRAVSATALGP